MIALASALLMQAAASPPPRWVVLGESDSGSIWSADTRTSVLADDTLRVRISIDHARDRTAQASRSRGLLVISCAWKRSRWESLTAFGANGRALPRRGPATSFFDAIAPGSPIERVWQWGCRNPGAP